MLGGGGGGSVDDDDGTVSSSFSRLEKEGLVGSSAEAAQEPQEEARGVANRTREIFQKQPCHLNTKRARYNSKGCFRCTSTSIMVNSMVVIEGFYC
jgi:hypothetical protein